MKSHFICLHLFPLETHMYHCQCWWHSKTVTAANTFIRKNRKKSTISLVDGNEKLQLDPAFMAVVKFFVNSWMFLLSRRNSCLYCPSGSRLSSLIAFPWPFSSTALSEVGFSGPFCGDLLFFQVWGSWFKTQIVKHFCLFVFLFKSIVYLTT